MILDIKAILYITNIKYNELKQPFIDLTNQEIIFWEAKIEQSSVIKSTNNQTHLIYTF